MKKRKSEVSFEDSLSYDAEGNELHLEDILGTDKNIITKKIEDKELEGLTEDEKYEYIHKYCFEYLMDNLEIGIEDIEPEVD